MSSDHEAKTKILPLTIREVEAGEIKPNDPVLRLFVRDGKKFLAHGWVIADPEATHGVAGSSSKIKTLKELQKKTHKKGNTPRSDSIWISKPDGVRRPIQVPVKEIYRPHPRLRSYSFQWIFRAKA